ncbi:MAG: L-lactate dehydrogenase [Acidobacteriaceae bacterium]|jgi:L-lactate dehydrogenase|nr:L-lactate dehydrogenase [Acidobacteriaceae bacterium]
MSVFDVSQFNDQKLARTRIPRVAIVGTGFVGSTTAYALLLSRTPAEIVLIDRDERRADGHVQDLRDAEVFSHTTRVVTGQFDDCCSADVIIITAGASQSGRRSRLENLNETAAILKGLVRDVARSNPHGILLIASNPVDVLTYAAWKWSGLPPGRVIGSGTSLDTSRFRRRLAEHYGVASDNVHAYVIGEHGESQVALISSARIAGVPLESFCRELNLPYEKDGLRQIATDTQAAGLEIIRAKGATYYGIGTALARIADAILRDEHAVLTVSSLAPASMELGEVSLSLPTIIARDGVARVVSIPLDASERQALEASAETLKHYIATLETSETILS